MDTLAFIAALGVSIALMAWYFACEAAGSDGGLGWFAIRGGADQSGGDQAADNQGRYKMRPRLTPDKRAALHARSSEKAYRVKAPGKAAWKPEAQASIEADKEY